MRNQGRHESERRRWQRGERTHLVAAHWLPALIARRACRRRARRIVLDGALLRLLLLLLDVERPHAVLEVDHLLRLGRLGVAHGPGLHRRPRVLALEGDVLLLKLGELALESEVAGGSDARRRELARGREGWGAVGAERVLGGRCWDCGRGSCERGKVLGGLACSATANNKGRGRTWACCGDESLEGLDAGVDVDAPREDPRARRARRRLVVLVVVVVVVAVGGEVDDLGRGLAALVRGRGRGAGGWQGALVPRHAAAGPVQQPVPRAKGGESERSVRRRTSR